LALRIFLNPFGSITGLLSRRNRLLDSIIFRFLVKKGLEVIVL